MGQALLFLLMESQPFGVNIEARGNLNASEKLELMEQIENEMVKYLKFSNFQCIPKGESLATQKQKVLLMVLVAFMVELPFLEEDTFARRKEWL